MLPNVRTQAVKRIKNIQGQLDGVVRMIEKDTYCIDVLIQLKAIQAALTSAKNLILEGYLHSCMLSGIKSGKEEETLKELMSIVKYGD